jgi:hypothetical protein
MTPRATLSPAWLGLFALATFGGLVVASFTSGYHLVMKTAPLADSLASGDSLVPGAEPALDGAAGAGGAAAAPASAKVSEPAKGADGARAATDPAEALVRTNLPPDRALVWAKPESRQVVGRLPSKQRVTLLGRQGTWVRIEFKRSGKHVSGWTMDSNLQLN